MQFLRKNLRRSVFLIILFFAANLLILLGFVLFDAWQMKQSVFYNSVSMGTVAGEIQTQGALSQETAARIRENGSFFMEISPAGEVLQSVNLPENLNHRYTLGEVASFVRWYLNDQVVRTEILDDGSLLVLAYPKGSATRVNYFGPYDSIFAYFQLIALLLIGNLLLFIYLSWSQARKVEKAVDPVLKGIDALANAKPVSLSESGPLEKVNAQINQLSDKISRRENNRSEWIRAASHDIRTPLMIISAQTEKLEAGASPDALASLESIRSGVHRIASLIDSLNLNNRLDYALTPVTLRPALLSQVLREEVIDALNEHPDSGIRLALEIDPQAERREVLLDADLFTRVTDNLMRNSAQHNEDPVSLRIRLTEVQPGRELSLVFEDDGQGAPPEVYALLNSQHGDFPEGASHGLGLQIVRKIVRLHGAAIRFSPSQSGGFRAEIRFPRITDPSPDSKIRA